MPDSIILYVVLVAAIGIGFYLGRRERHQRVTARREDAMQDYYRDLNLVLGDEHDLAVERFIESMPVDAQSFETHMALGALLRTRGEVDKAIRIHQNLIGSGSLSGKLVPRAELALARDFFQAGLLDRAESLLQQLLERRTQQRVEAQTLLLDIYERERDWTQAIAVGRSLQVRDASLNRRLAHFACELALEALHSHDLKEARRCISRGLEYDSACARLQVVTAEIETAALRPKHVLKAVKRALDLDPTLLGELSSLYSDACFALGTPQEYAKFLESRLQQDPKSFAALRELVPIWHDQLATEDFLARCRAAFNPLSFQQYLRLLPALQGLLTPEQLLALTVPASEEAQPVVDFRCRECGLALHSHLWQCPRCHAWDAISVQD